MSVLSLVKCQETRLWFEDPIHAFSPDLVFRIGDRAYRIIDYHDRICGVAWHCLEDIATGDHFDIQYVAFERYLDLLIVRLNAMEALAYASKEPE